MTDTTKMTDTTMLDPAEVGEVVGQVVADLAATAGLQMTHLGIRTGLWKAMAGADPSRCPRWPGGQEWPRSTPGSG